SKALPRGSVVKRLKGLRDLVFDAIEDTTNLVQRTHETVAERAVRRYVPVEPLQTSAEAVNAVHLAGAAAVYATIRGVSRVVHAVTSVGTDPVLDAAKELEAPPTPQRSDALGSFSWLVDHLEGALNGFAGDRLRERGNDLALG